MAKLGVVAAAEAAGVSRHTIWRYTKSGKLSCENTPAGDRVIDTSEFVRVFGDLQHTETWCTRRRATVCTTLTPAQRLQRCSDTLRSSEQR